MKLEEMGGVYLNQINIQISGKQIPKKKVRKWTMVSLLLIVFAFVLLNYGTVKKQPNNPFFQSVRPLVIAHQGGELLAPSNTMAAFNKAVELGADVLEFDIHITMDGQLVAIHDKTVDRTTNGKGKVHDFTLEDLQKLDAGYHFKDLNGEFSYRGKEVYIPTVEEIFKAFPDMRMIIEIKANNPPERIQEISESFWDLIKEYRMEEQIIVASFSQEIVQHFQELTNGRVAVAAGEAEVKKFVLLKKFFLANLFNTKVNAIQIPTEASIFNLAHPSIIKEAQRRNLIIQYWTIDDKKTMRTLIEHGADGIMTNRPDLMIELLHEMGY